MENEEIAKLRDRVANLERIVLTHGADDQYMTERMIQIESRYDRLLARINELQKENDEMKKRLSTDHFAGE